MSILSHANWFSEIRLKRIFCSQKVAEIVYEIFGSYLDCKKAICFCDIVDDKKIQKFGKIFGSNENYDNTNSFNY